MLWQWILVSRLQPRRGGAREGAAEELVVFWWWCWWSGASTLGGGIGFLGQSPGKVAGGGWCGSWWIWDLTVVCAAAWRQPMIRSRRSLGVRLPPVIFSSQDLVSRSWWLLRSLNAFVQGALCSRDAGSLRGALPPATAAGLARCGGDGSDEDGVLGFLLSTRVFLLYLHCAVCGILDT